MEQQDRKRAFVKRSTKRDSKLSDRINKAMKGLSSQEKTSQHRAPSLDTQSVCVEYEQAMAKLLSEDTAVSSLIQVEQSYSKLEQLQRDLDKAKKLIQAQNLKLMLETRKLSRENVLL